MKRLKLAVKRLPFGLMILGLGMSTSLQAQDAGLIDGLATGVSKAMYLTQECNTPIDREKFKTVADLKAFVEGYGTVEGVNWAQVKPVAEEKLAELEKRYPNGQHCEALKTQAENILPMLTKV